MLSQLHIENVAVIEKADLDLDSGFNVLTGETGAGKSILIDSINFVLGERTSRDIVRTGAQAAHVTALFTDVSRDVSDRLGAVGFACDEDGSLLISRDISADGRTVCHISGRPATVSILRDIGRLLVNIHGQHDNQALLSAEKHVVYLDRYAGLKPLLDEYGSKYSQMKQTERELAKLETDAADKARRIDLLNYQINEITAAAPEPGEDDDLSAKKAHLQNADRIAEAVGNAYALLSGGEDGEGAQELTERASTELSGITEVYPEIAPLAERIESLSLDLDDCVSELREYVGEDEGDLGSIDDIEQRLDTLYRLKLKYGGSLEAVAQYLENAQNELDSIENSDANAKKYRKQLDILRSEANEIAGKITAARKNSAAEMSEKIKKELAFLEMPDVQFCAQVSALKDLSPNGADDVEFLISVNPGSPLKPLAKIASGGEISRIMLGIKTVLAGNDDIDTLIFDEIDTGVSGRAAQKIGLKLKEVSASRQVVCVTHLSQIAAQADRHILIKKNVADGKTFTGLTTLDFNGRAYELARIMAGAEITELTLKNAEEMLNNSGIQPER